MTHLRQFATIGTVAIACLLFSSPHRARAASSISESMTNLKATAAPRRTNAAASIALQSGVDGTTAGVRFETPPINPQASQMLLPYMLGLQSGETIVAFSNIANTSAGKEARTVRSLDGGQSWETSVSVSTTSGIISKLAGGMVELQNGHVLMSYHDGDFNTGDVAIGRLRIARTTDKGQSWHDLSICHDSNLSGIWEGILLQLPDGRILCQYATEEFAASGRPNALCQRVSTDNGVTWGPQTIVASEIASRDGVPSLVRLPTGRLICFFEAQDWWNVFPKPDDFFISYVTSDDDGATWSPQRRLVTRNTSAETFHRHTAPYVTLLPNGKILVAYYASDGYGPRPADFLVDLYYVESDPPYTRWSAPQFLIGLPNESDRWGSFLSRGGNDLDFIYQRDFHGPARSTPFLKGRYEPNAADLIDDAKMLTGNPATWSASNTEATVSPGEATHAGAAGGHSVWWRWTPSQSGTALVTTRGTNFDTVLAVYTRFGDNLTLVTSNDDAPGGDHSEIEFAASSAGEYWIAVDGKAGATGLITLRAAICVGSESIAMLSPATFPPVESTPVKFRWSPVAAAKSYALYLDGATIATNLTTTDFTLTAPLTNGIRNVWVTADTPCGLVISPTLTFQARDLALTGATFSPVAPASIEPGALLPSSWILNGPATVEPIWFEFFASRTGGFDRERFGGTVTGSFPSAHAGGLLTYTPGNQIVNQLPSGLYSIIAHANRVPVPANAETNSTNNSYAIPGQRLVVHKTEQPVADLAWQSPPNITMTNSQIFISGTVINQGTGPSPAYGFWVESIYGYLSNEGLFQRLGFLGGGSKVNQVLQPGQTANYSGAWGRPPGTAAVATLIDSTDLVPETNEANNFRRNSDPAAQSGTVDLEITAFTIPPASLSPASLATGAQLPFTVTVRNNSASDSGLVWLEIFGSQTGGLDVIRSGTTLCESALITVPAGTTHVVDIARPINPIADGLYTPVAMVNRLGTGGPADPIPGNNLRTMTSGRLFLRNPASAGANLAWQTPPRVVRTGLTVEITGTIVNSGSAASGPFWTEAFSGAFLADGTFEKTGALGGGIYCTGLAPGQTFPIAKTETLQSAFDHVGVITDSTDIVSETQETDNYLHVRMW